MASDNEDVSMEIPSGSLALIAQPLAGKKLHKKLLKLVKKGNIFITANSEKLREIGY